MKQALKIVCWVVLLPNVGFSQLQADLPPRREAVEVRPLASTGWTCDVTLAKPPHLVALEGVWTAVPNTKDGSVASTLPLSGERLVVSGKHVAIIAIDRRGGSRLSHLEDRISFTIGPDAVNGNATGKWRGATKPRVVAATIEYERLSEEQQLQGLPSKTSAILPTNKIRFMSSSGLQTNGIWKVEGNELTICLARFGEATPTRFDSRSSSTAALTVYRREESLKD